MANERCETCRFFEATPKGNRGSCRRYPPNNNGFTTTYPESWCGEYKADPLKQKPHTQEK